MKTEIGDFKKAFQKFNDYEDQDKSEIKKMVDELVKKMRELDPLPDISINDVHRKFTTKELLDSIDIDKIDTYVRTKKIQRIQKNIKK